VVGNNKIALYLREPGRGQISYAGRVHQAVDLQHFQLLDLPADSATRSSIIGSPETPCRICFARLAP
jgi:hypothetical protein